MKLTKTSAYALTACLQLAAAKPGATLNTESICGPANMPPRYVIQMLSQLVKAGVVSGRTGRGGGYTLAKPAAKISLLAIIEAVEGPLANSGANDASHLPAKPRKAIERACAAIVADARKRLASITLAELRAAKAA